MDDFVTRVEYDERMKRIDDENARQNHRIGKLEDIMASINELTVSVREMAVSMQSMQREQEKQGKRLEAIEKTDGEKWRNTVKTVITVIVSAVVTYLLAKGGL